MPHGADTRASGSRQVVLARLSATGGRPPPATRDPEGCHSPGWLAMLLTQEPVGQLGSAAARSMASTNIVWVTAVEW